MPFGNELIVKSVTGDVLLKMLEEQFGADRRRIMQVSSGFTYAYDPSRPPVSAIDRESVRINGAPLDPKRQYRLATSNFLWDSGDGMSALLAGTDPLLVGTDYDLLADYFSRHSPVQPGPQNRIRIPLSLRGTPLALFARHGLTSAYGCRGGPSVRQGRKRSCCGR